MRAACCLPSSAALPSDLFLLSHFTESLSLSRPPSYPPPLRLRRRGRTAGSRILVSFVRSFFVRWMCPFSPSSVLSAAEAGSLSAASFRPRHLRLYSCMLLSFIPELMAYYDSGAQSQSEPQEASPRLHVELRSRRASNGAYCESHFQRRAFRRPGDVAGAASRIHNSI